MSIISFPAKGRCSRGTIHVTGDRAGGFNVDHESSSGDSWGCFSGPYTAGQDAIAAAYALNRDEMGGACGVVICDAAIRDPSPDAGIVSPPGEW